MARKKKTEEEKEPVFVQSDLWIEKIAGLLGVIAAIVVFTGTFICYIL